MNTEERQKRIEELQDEIKRLDKEEVQECSKRILPFLQEHCELLYNGSIFSFDIKIKKSVDLWSSRDLESTLISLIGGNTWVNGPYHFGAPVADYFDARYDDGHITLNYNPNNSDSFKMDLSDSMIINELKKLRLRVSIEDYVGRVRNQISQELKYISEAENIAKELNGNEN